MVQLNNKRVIKVTSAYVGEQGYNDVFPHIKHLVDAKKALAPVVKPEANEEFSCVFDYSTKSELLRIVEQEQLHDVIVIDEHTIDESGEPTQEKQLFPPVDEFEDNYFDSLLDEKDDEDSFANEDLAEDEGFLFDDEDIFKEKVEVATVEQDEAKVSLDTTEFEVGNEISELMPTIEDIRGELNPYITGVEPSTNPLVVLTAQQHGSNINTLYALQSERLMNLDYDVLEKELANFEAGALQRNIPEVSKYAQAKQRRNTLVTNAATTADTIRETRETQFNEWIDARLEELKAQYAKENPDTTQQQINELYASVQTQIDETDEEIEVNRRLAKQAVVREFARSNRNPSLTTALTFVLTKEKARDAINEVAETLKNEQVQFVTASKAAPVKQVAEEEIDDLDDFELDETPVVEETIDIDDIDSLDDLDVSEFEIDDEDDDLAVGEQPLWNGYTHEEIEAMSDEELAELNRRYQAGEDITKPSAKEAKEEPILFTDDEEEGEIDLGLTQKIPVLSDEDIANSTLDLEEDFDAADFSFGEEVEVETPQIEVPELNKELPAIEDDFNFDTPDLGHTAEFDNILDDPSLTTSFNVDELMDEQDVEMPELSSIDELKGQLDDISFDEEDDDVLEPEIDLDAKPSKKGKGKAVKKPKAPTEKNSSESSKGKTGKRIAVGALAVGAVAVVGTGIFFGTKALNPSAPSQTQTTNTAETTQSQAEIAKAFFERAAKAGIAVDESIEVTIDGAKATARITKLNDNGSITAVLEDGTETEIDYAVVKAQVDEFESSLTDVPDEGEASTEVGSDTTQSQ